MSDLYVSVADITPQNIKDFVAAAYCADAGYSYDPGCYSEAIWEMSGGSIRYGDVFISCQRTGGGEGSGEYMDVVWTFKDDNSARYFKETGRYYSFVGGEWNDDMREVFPRQVEVTVYE
jgi:hypothetical protein